ncbi:uncharacterized protein F5Z01DRAFT_698869 [Emericellopsis atlantica]|uniref:Uncharacterized protein n=1 Tax=Emericellopsis atlantica TaxID=2614577 RepID=A0A9P7ZPZ4_9HYPO|nr:uncharacterized protein F5Z01DRAFT_698869 [Emericellopsis atlantica]KAG9256045.1 hypothetical protein F5Z01DRAFT_698869 [Emericellopsis atlantica]
MIPRPKDVFCYDDPARDTDRFLKHANEYAEHGLSTPGKEIWKPGCLIGPDGADEDVKNLSKSYVPWENRSEVTESRSATSSSHGLIHPRPRGVCVGWGGYDEFIDWQLHGRAVRREMVEHRDYQIPPPENTPMDLPPLELVDEDGNVEVVTSTLGRKVLAGKPVQTLYDKIHRSKAHYKKGPKASSNAQS